MSTAHTLDNLFTNVDSQRESEREGGPTIQLDTWKPVRDIAVTKVSQDYDWVEVFKDSEEAYYATSKVPIEQFLLNWVITLKKLNYESRLVDKTGHKSRMLNWTELREMIWKEKPLFNFTCTTTTAVPEDSAYHAETIIPPYAQPEATFTDWGKGRESPSQWNTYGDSHHVCPATPRPEPLRPVRPVGPTPVAVPYPIRPMPSGQIPRGPMPTPSRPAPMGATPIRPLHMPMRPLPIGPVPRIPVRDPEGSAYGFLDAHAPRVPRRHKDDHHRKIRPLALMKMVKKYDGSGDPHDHVAAFNQAVQAEQVTDTHVQT